MVPSYPEVAAFLLRMHLLQLPSLQCLEGSFSFELSPHLQNKKSVSCTHPVKVSLLNVVFTRTGNVGETAQQKLLLKIGLSSSRTGWEEGSKVVLAEADDS